jgi:Asp-tRNA(Asn)/Glu-tRNA(Gln) amidotransferase A subunit family amidase
MMTTSRRDLLTKTSLSLAGVMLAKARVQAQPAATPGAPPAFGTSPAVGPAVSAQTFIEAAKLLQIENSAKNIEEMASNWQQSMAALYERRVGPRKLALEDSVVPATVFNPVLPSVAAGPRHDAFTASPEPHLALPTSDTDIAFAPVTALSFWIKSRQLSAERLTEIYLARLEKFSPSLLCVITLTRDHALQQARQADREIAAGHYRGPLHGIPWGAKDLLDTAGIKTTYGAEPFRDRVPTKDATVTARLTDAGAVLVAKLSLGALALNDVWFGGQTKNPWAIEEGASGSSAGPGAAVAAGLVAFAIGSETQGSIVSPTMRCGITGLRPSFGRVPRSGAMTLSWSCDKLGPMTRSVEDTMLVLRAIAGPDQDDVACLPAKLAFQAGASVKGKRVGYIPDWINQPPATDVDRHALELAKQLGMVPVEVALPDWPYDSLNVILFAESAAAFEEITLNGKVEDLLMQVPDAWPNSFRQSRFLSAVDFVQADRLRRKVAMEMAQIFKQVDLLLVPSLRDEFLVITNFTGQPSLTLRAGFVEITEARSDWAPDPANPLPKFAPPRRVPHGVTLVADLFEEGALAEAGMALEQAFNVSAERPAGY